MNLKMGQSKEISIKSAYDFFGDMINTDDFHSNFWKIDKKLYRDINIYYIGYIVIKKFTDYENIQSMNQLHLIIYSATGCLMEKTVKNT